MKAFWDKRPVTHWVILVGATVAVVGGTIVGSIFWNNMPVTLRVILVGAIVGGILIVGYTVGSGALGFGPHRVKTIKTDTFDAEGKKSGTQETIETQSYRTVWDWMTVITISAVVAGVAWWFASNQQEQQQRIQQQQAKDAALLAYLDTMSQLIFDRHLLESASDDNTVKRDHENARAVAQASTLVALGKVGPDHKRSIVKFLYESGLIKTQPPIVDLTDANLLDAKLKKGEFPGIDLSDALLKDGEDDNQLGAILEEANLEAANLQEANLRSANLEGAYLVEAIFSDGEDGNQIGASLREANLQNANLQGANLTRARLQGANLKGANLQGANLEGAILKTGASGDANNKLLNKQGANLKGATMPDGSKHP